MRSYCGSSICYTIISGSTSIRYFTEQKLKKDILLPKLYLSIHQLRDGISTKDTYCFVRLFKIQVIQLNNLLM
jgi:hypothetical protein